MAKALTVTCRGGFSLASSLLPIENVPARMLTISGQFAQSRFSVRPGGEAVGGGKAAVRTGGCAGAGGGAGRSTGSGGGGRRGRRGRRRGRADGGRRGGRGRRGEHHRFGWCWDR